MKAIMLLTLFVLIIGCSSTQSTKYGLYNESTSNINYPTTDSILVGTDYKVIGTTNKFVGTSNSCETFAVEFFRVEYPKFAKDNKIEGIVILQVEVFADGTVGHVVVKQSLMPGPGGLDEAAIKSIKKWIFKPAIYNGEPVACWTTFPITFSLK